MVLLKKLYTIAILQYCIAAINNHNYKHTDNSWKKKPVGKGIPSNSFPNLVFKIAIKSALKALSDDPNVGKRGVAYLDHSLKIESILEFIFNIV